MEQCRAECNAARKAAAVRIDKAMRVRDRALKNLDAEKNDGKLPKRRSSRAT